MSLILASLFSRKSKNAGLMVYDTEDSSARLLQIVDFASFPFRLRQIRGISLSGDRLYALTSCALLVFRISNNPDGPVFLLQKKVCRPEWIMGNNEQGNLHAVFACQKRRRVYVSFNAQSAVDSFDLDGNFLQRRYLWEISPTLFPLPNGEIDKEFRFGIIRHMFPNEQNELMLTTALLNGKQDSAIIDYDTGRRVLSLESKPVHGGLMHGHNLYLCAMTTGMVLSYRWPDGQSHPEIGSARQFSPIIANTWYKGSEQKTRGLVMHNERLLCGVFHTCKSKSKQIPPRIVEFDPQSGVQLREHMLPSLQELEEPHIYALSQVSAELVQAIAFRDAPLFYHGNSTIKPVWIVREPPAGDSSSIDEEKLKMEARTPSCEISNDKEGREAVNPRIDLSGHDLATISEIQRPLQNKPMVIFENVGLCFERSAMRLFSFKRNPQQKKVFWAIQDLSFIVYEGETLGVIGRNGSGKSTLSMICGGVLLPDKGSVRINGRAQLLALRVGFKNELSGRENVFISASLLGLSKKDISAKMDDIEEFSELGEFMDEPVRIYSSGMRSRLGFAVATAVKPDILILDEVMATGDKAFRDKAMRRMREMRGLARCAIVVSHSPVELRKLSTKVLWLEKGRAVMLGDPKEVLNSYDQFCQHPDKWLRNHPELSGHVVVERACNE